MRFIILTILFLFHPNTKCSKEHFEYDPLYAAVKFIDSTSGGNIRMYSTSYPYPRQKEFLTKETLKRYIGSVPNLDEGEFQDLLDKIDFPFLLEQQLISVKLVPRKLPQGIEYFDVSPDRYAKGEYYAISAPIVSKQKDVAFVFYLKSCGYLCSAWNVIILKKESKVWRAHLVLPVTL